MQIPRGKAGKTLIAEVTRLIRLFNSSKRWESVAILMLQVLLPLIFQYNTITIFRSIFLPRTVSTLCRFVSYQ